MNKWESSSSLETRAERGRGEAGWRCKLSLSGGLRRRGAAVRGLWLLRLGERRLRGSVREEARGDAAVVAAGVLDAVGGAEERKWRGLGSVQKREGLKWV